MVNPCKRFCDNICTGANAILPVNTWLMDSANNCEVTGFVKKWAKGETTAKNEYRYIMGMQQGKINYKEDGLNKILEVLEVEASFSNISLIKTENSSRLNFPSLFLSRNLNLS